MRLTGGIFLVLAGLMGGLRSVSELRENVRRRECLLRLLDGLSYEMKNFRPPLPALFSAMSGRTEGAGRELCLRISEGLEKPGNPRFACLWEDAVCLLPPGEREALRPLGSVLGQYAAEEQVRALERVRGEMERLLDEARVRMRERGRVSVGLWTAAGLMAAVILI